MTRFTLLCVTLAMVVTGCSALVDTSLFGYGAITPNAGPDQVVPPSSTVTLDASASTQSAGKTLSFTWEQTSGTPVTLDDPSSATPTFEAPEEIGTLEFSVRVDDGAPGEMTDTVTITVDTAPILPPIADLETMTVTKVYLNAARGYDPDDEGVIATWTQTSGPAVQLTGASSPIATFMAPRDATTLGFRVELCDPLGACVDDELIVTVYKWIELSGSIALRSDGTVWGWGNNVYSGALGPDPIEHSYPVRINDLTDVVDIEGTSGATFSRTADGTLYAQGLNHNGALGIANTPGYEYDIVREATPVHPKFQSATAFAHASTGSLWLMSDGSLVAAGRNVNGELGNCSLGAVYATPDNNLTLPMPTSGGVWTHVSLSSNAARARSSSGWVHVWGKNDHGVFGNGAPASSTCSTSLTAGMYAPPRSVSLAASQGTMVTSTGGLYSWGHRYEDGTNDLLEATPRGYFSSGWATASTSTSHTLAVTSTGDLYAWGSNDSGQLGVTLPSGVSGFPPTGITPPMRVDSPSAGEEWLAVSAVGSTSIGLKRNGSILSFGSGLLAGGDPSGTSARTTPKQIAANLASCGDGRVESHTDPEFQSGYLRTGRPVYEACDDGPFNGSPGACSASCRCPSTRVVYVNSMATGTGDGLSWTNAMTTLQAAADLAGSCDTIWVARGVYTGPSADPHAPVVTLANDAEIFGGFAGHETVFAQRDPVRNEVILDGSGTRRHVVVAGNAGQLDGITVRNGNADSASPGGGDRGAGLYLAVPGTGTFVVRGVRFVGNRARAGGGAIAGRETLDPQQTLYVSDSTFESNVAMAGGAIEIQAGRVLISGSRFVGNRAEGTSSGGREGGAIRGSTGTQVGVVNSEFIMNAATDAGSAIWFGGSNHGALPLSFITAYGNFGAGAVFHWTSTCLFPCITGAATLTHAASWNPGAGADAMNVEANYGCFASGRVPTPGIDPSTNVELSLDTDGFWVTGSGPSTRVSLAEGGGCVDIGNVGSAYGALPTWRHRSATSNGALDDGTPDAGRHRLP